MITGGLSVSDLICDTCGILFTAKISAPTIPTACDGLIWIEETSPCPGLLKFTNSVGTYNVIQDLQGTYDISAIKTLNLNDTNGLIFNDEPSPTYSFSGCVNKTNVNLSMISNLGCLNITYPGYPHFFLDVRVSGACVPGIFKWQGPGFE